MTQQGKGSVNKCDGLSSALWSTWWKERTNLCNPSSTHGVAMPPAPAPH